MKRSQEAFAIYWWDIESDAGWGKPPKIPCLCTSLGFVVEEPNDTQKVRAYRLVTSYTDDKEPGGGTIIPEPLVVEILSLGSVVIRSRKSV